jgi:hypothetical protein
MELSAEYGAHVERIRGLVGEMHDHLKSAVTSHEKGDAKGVASAHTRLGRCLRSADVTFAKMAHDAVLQDIHNSQKTQNSDGVSEGTSSPPRAAHPLMTGDVAGWARRAFGGKTK